MPNEYKCRTTDYDEGWSVFACDDGKLRIQRLDTPRDVRDDNPAEPMFADDEAAVALVRMLAKDGSLYHAHALALHEEIDWRTMLALVIEAAPSFGSVDYMHRRRWANALLAGEDPTADQDPPNPKGA